MSSAAVLSEFLNHINTSIPNKVKNSLIFISFILRIWMFLKNYIQRENKPHKIISLQTDIGIYLLMKYYKCITLLGMIMRKKKKKQQQNTKLANVDFKQSWYKT